MSALHAQDFDDKAFWAGPLLSLQKVTVAGVLVFFKPSYTQSLAGLLVSMLWGFVLARVGPYPTAGENVCATVLNCSVSLIMLGAIASKLLTVRARDVVVQRSFTSGVLWLSVVTAFGATFLSIFIEWAYGDWRKSKEDEEEEEEEKNGADDEEEGTGKVTEEKREVEGERRIVLAQPLVPSLDKVTATPSTPRTPRQQPVQGGSFVQPLSKKSGSFVQPLSRRSRKGSTVVISDASESFGEF